MQYGFSSVRLACAKHGLLESWLKAYVVRVEGRVVISLRSGRKRARATTAVIDLLVFDIDGRPLVWCEHQGDFLQATRDGAVTLRSRFCQWSAPRRGQDIGSGGLIWARVGNAAYRGGRRLYRQSRSVGTFVAGIGRAR